MYKKVLCSVFVTYMSLFFLSYSNNLPKMVTKAEMKIQSKWMQTHLQNSKVSLPFSFVYNGKKSSEFLFSWTQKTKIYVIDKNRTQYQQTWIDQNTGLSVCCVFTVFSDYPVLEWTVYFKNTSDKNTPIISELEGLNTTFMCDKNAEFVLHCHKGDFMAEDGYEPFDKTLVPNSETRFGPKSGRSCNGPNSWPYYNLQMNNRGIIIAIGWPGQWASSFTRDAENELTAKAEQQHVNCYLKPGEEIRTPLISLMFWKDKDIVDAQNLWRRYYIAHIIPSFNGQPQQPILQIQVTPHEKDTAYVESFLKAGIKPDICWRDAGWYQMDSSYYKGDEKWKNTGTWEIDTLQYPRGFKIYSDWIHRHGMQFLVWFEPERVGNYFSWLKEKHSEWLLKGKSHDLILDEGNDNVQAWLIDYMDRFIKMQGLDWYREDFNIGPLSAWRNNDAPDRQGITENMYIQGHLAYWDALKSHNKKLHIDACASGGCRNDLETMKRAVPLLRSDFQWPYMKNVVRGNQGHTYGLSSWFPFQGTGVYCYDSYSFRSFYLPGFGMGTLTSENTAAQQQAYLECSKIAPDMLFGDYYPLTPYSIDANHWIAWQFNRPEIGTGFVQVFRRDSCETSSITFHLRGLNLKDHYQITNFDKKEKIILTGKELAEEGLKVEISDKPGSAIITYKKQ